MQARKSLIEKWCLFVDEQNLVTTTNGNEGGKGREADKRIATQTSR